jgi:hypothetical protein
VKLPANATKPKTSYKKAGNSPFPQWFRAEEKEKPGFVEFTDWEPLSSSQIKNYVISDMMDDSSNHASFWAND